MSSIFAFIDQLEITFCEEPVFPFGISAFFLLICRSSLYILNCPLSAISMTDVLGGIQEVM